MSDPLQSLADRAARHMAAGRFAEAATDFAAVLAREPDHPDIWYNLGYAQRRAREFEAALDSYRQALDRGIGGREEVHLNRAVILAHDLGRSDEARAELEAALKIAPRYFPALLNLGGIHEDRGEREAARAAYARALEIEPGDTLVLTRLAVLSEIESADDPLIARIRGKIDDVRTPDSERADLGFALGQILDRLGDYDGAFAAYASANRASRASHGAERLYDAQAEEAKTGRIIAAFAAPGDSAERTEGVTPLFICGMFRSGSTLAEQILARHSRVTAGGELDLVPALVAGEFGGDPEAMARAARATLDRLRARHDEALASLHPGADIVTDKRPDNFRHIGLIKRLFPEARIVDTRRNPIDNCLSIWFAHLGPRQPYATDLSDIVHWYREYRRLMAHWKTLWPDDIFELDYDALVADPEPRIRALVEFCGLDWEQACLEPHRGEGTVRTLSAWQVRQPVYKSSSGRWRNYERQIGPLIEAFSDE